MQTIQVKYGEREHAHMRKIIMKCGVFFLSSHRQKEQKCGKKCEREKKENNIMKIIILH